MSRIKWIIFLFWWLQNNWYDFGVTIARKFFLFVHWWSYDLSTFFSHCLCYKCAGIECDREHWNLIVAPSVKTMRINLCTYPFNSWSIDNHHYSQCCVLLFLLHRNWIFLIGFYSFCLLSHLRRFAADVLARGLFFSLVTKLMMFPVKISHRNLESWWSDINRNSERTKTMEMANWQGKKIGCKKERKTTTNLRWRNVRMSCDF